MSSPSGQYYCGTFVGAGADITVTKVPFRPKRLMFITETAGIVGIKTEDMPATNYYVAAVGLDTGVTIRDDGFLIANAADVNVPADIVWFEAIG